jgi:hypothetical protein
MPRGGARPGAGRKPGSRNKLTLGRAVLLRKQLAKRLVSGRAHLGELTPLDVMLTTMRTLAAQEEWEFQLLACQLAKEAAPYFHPRLTAVKGALELSVNPLKELMERIGKQGSGLPYNPERSILQGMKGRPVHFAKTMTIPVSRKGA